MMKRINVSNSKLGKTLIGATAGLALLVGTAMADISGKVYEGRLNGVNLQAIPNATVIIRSPEGTTRSTTTNTDGFYQFTGDVTDYKLEALADSHWSALKENLVNNVECYVILPARVGDLAEMKSLNNTTIEYNGSLMSQRRTGQPIPVYFQSDYPDPWPADKKTNVLNRMNYHEQFTGKDLYEEVFTLRTSTDHGINVRYDEDGFSNTSRLFDNTDIYNRYIRLANVTLNSAGAALWAVMDKELFSMCHDLGSVTYIPTCTRSPPDDISDKDVMYFNVCDDFRPVFLTVRDAHPGAQITNMNELAPNETPIAVESTSWGAIKNLFK